MLNNNKVNKFKIWKQHLRKKQNKHKNNMIKKYLI